MTMAIFCKSSRSICMQDRPTVFLEMRFRKTTIRVSGLAKLRPSGLNWIKVREEICNVCDTMRWCKQHYFASPCILIIFFSCIKLVFTMQQNKCKRRCTPQCHFHTRFLAKQCSLKFPKIKVYLYFDIKNCIFMNQAFYILQNFLYTVPYFYILSESEVNRYFCNCIN